MQPSVFEVLLAWVGLLCALATASASPRHAFVAAHPWAMARRALHGANTSAINARGAGQLQASLDAGVMEHVMQLYNKEHVDQLVRLAATFSGIITNLEDVRMAHITRVTPDGDGVDLEVIYCDEQDNRCVALSVPILFTRSCEDETCIIEEMDYLEKHAREAQVMKEETEGDLKEELSRFREIINGPDFAQPLRELASKNYVDDHLNTKNIYPHSLTAKAVEQPRMLFLNRHGFLIECLAEDEGHQHRSTIRIPVMFEKECSDGHEVAEAILRMVANCASSA